MELFRKYQVQKELFLYSDHQTLLDALLNISNKKLNYFIKILSNRYKIANIGKYIYEDVYFLAKLAEGISEYLNKNKKIGNPKEFLLRSLVNEILEIIKHLEQTK